MILGLLSWAAAIAADDREPWGPDAEDASSSTEATAPLLERRDLPDYDGRDLPTPAGLQLLWVPRTLLAPAYALDKYVLYPPIRAVSIWAEKNHIPVRLVDSLTVFDEAYRLRIYPTTLVDFGLRPSVGAYIGLRGNNAPHSRGSVQVAWGGREWFAVNLRESVALTADGRQGESTWAGSDVSISLLYSDRPDRVFFGIGALSGDQRTRFTQQQVAGDVSLHAQLPRWAAADLALGVDRSRFDAGFAPFFNDPSIDAVFDVRQIPGFEGYALLYGDLGVTLDTRPRRRHAGSGARLEVDQRLGADLDGAYDVSRTSAELSGFVDVSGEGHAFGLSQFAGASGSPSGGSAPFTQLMTLGGGEYLRGFLGGRFRGPSALSTTLQYGWPVWVFTDAALFAEVGGVYDELTTVSLDQTVASFGTGLRTSGDRDTSFQLLVAVGTSPLSESVQVDQVRVVLGTNRGF